MQLKGHTYTTIDLRYIPETKCQPTSKNEYSFNQKNKSHLEAVIRIVSRVVSHSRKLSLSKLFLVQKHEQGV